MFMRIIIGNNNFFYYVVKSIRLLSNIFSKILSRIKVHRFPLKIFILISLNKVF
jgi:hypothetical protein